MNGTVFYFIISILIVAIFITTNMNGRFDWLIFGLVYGLTMVVIIAIAEYVIPDPKQKSASQNYSNVQENKPE